uniref:NADH dehydrogenase subunit 6 n=1 Tax=Leptophlebia marginata TaxID=551854 RepID=UPI001EDEB275|nr:NADH dehydrogenase subunit 6 [Leptophlebia marginata]YP_010261356.1 NADH dehydrogenase subunit 6 [Leptophlebia vespertina]UIB40250.1 NADH dehydrogenase subunit 6 [Leptophlebia marginata]UIB40263.1 NADH dehydrogenase subunit 6 [Leptophlebia vespertina]
MLLTLTITIIMTSLLFLMMNHPLAMALVLLMQTLAITLFTGLTSPTYWFSYILFLVFLGGVLVLFIYVTSLASNEMFSVSTMGTLMILSTMILSLMTFLLGDSFLTHMMIELQPLQPLNESYLYTTLAKLYTAPTFLLTLTLVLYLLITLIVVVKITSIHTGPLRQTY